MKKRKNHYEWMIALRFLWNGKGQTLLIILGVAIGGVAESIMKRTWVSHGLYHDWFDTAQGEGEEFYRRATEVKNIWVPYGE